MPPHPSTTSCARTPRRCTTRSGSTAGTRPSRSDAFEFVGLLGQQRAIGEAFEGPLLGDKAKAGIFDNSKVRTLVPDYVPEHSFE